MREILFRGKRLDNGEWIYGDICRHDGVISYIGQHPADGSMLCYDLDPSTIGQYTGIKDKNGKRIFEGDILSIWNESHDVVVFEDGAFDLENTSIPMRFANKFEVIGNITYNPELLEK